MNPRAAIVAALFFLACAGPPDPPHSKLFTVSDGRYAMGTLFEVTLVHRDPELARETLVEIFAEVDRLNALLSVWDSESEVSRLNSTAGFGPQKVSQDVARILSDSLDYSRLTGGSFDVTVQPLVRLWRDAAERDRLPGDEEIAAALAGVGARQVTVHGDRRVELRHAGVSLDLGGIAKGWALDQVVPRLRAGEFTGALLNFGQSSTWAWGTPAGAEGWRLLTRGPDDDFLGVLTLRDQALSISGSLGQSVEIRGRRYGHVLDPRSGLPLTARRQAVVVAPTAALAEALSKALLILGEVEGLGRVASQPGCAGLLAEAGGRVWTTQNWGDVVSFEILESPGAQAPPR